MTMPPGSRFAFRAVVRLLVRNLVKDSDGDGIPDSLEGLLVAARERAARTDTELDDAIVGWLAEAAARNPDWAEDTASKALRRAHRD